MSDPSEDVQAIESISTEIDKTKKKVIISVQCVKAQVYLAKKLRKQAEGCKETCNFISNANFKLQFEIAHAQQEIKSLLLAQNTIKMANVDLKKQWLLAKEKKLEITERIEAGEQKYEKLWLESKARYESLPFVQNLRKAKDDIENLKQQIIKLENDEKKLIAEIEAKKETCFKFDKKRIIELAGFMVNEMPKSFQLIKEKSAAIKDLTNELNLLKVKDNIKTEQPTTSKDTKIDPKTGYKADYLIPKLRLDNFDLDVLNVELDQEKLKKLDHSDESLEKLNISKLSLNQTDKTNRFSRKIANAEQYMSSFFIRPRKMYEDNKPKNYAKMKLINILQDIRIDKNEAHKIIKNANPDAFQPVDSISVDNKKGDDNCDGLKNQDKKLLGNEEEIEEIDLTKCNEEYLLIPPTQFLDITVEVQENPRTKRVSFDLPDKLDTNLGRNDDKIEENNDPETVDSQQNVSVVSDDGFAKMKDIIMKKHNLDMSPQFVYPKNIIAPLKSEDNVITSKFFQQNEKNSKVDEAEKVTNNNDQDVEVNKIAISPENNTKPVNQPKKNLIDEIDTEMGSGPKKPKLNEMVEPEKPASGFLFSRNAQMIADSLDVSMSTTGYEEGDTDFPHCIDASLLLSPKADFPTDKDQVQSQDVPNFLAGIRKTGFSIFGGLTSSEPKPESSSQNNGDSGFSFHFGGEQKKNRGGLFNMFK